ncbi:unnamed protein product [Eruca vesicaria subsp. sativa]|uniref:PHD finger protein ALFIN-LIKE n=1 Tax=Eruca vesicaria subsp. sativa TaxID=29727 RepID=A0ABC8KDV4_ERUVS|nr:unnamed protein product [Eruca vesicaria subsp. sativa]
MEGRAAEDVFGDFKGRRAGLIKALTTERRKFFHECDPAKENLCLYGLPNGSWEVNLPVDEVPPELPEPALGINFSREGMPEKKWISLVAIHSDSWLIAVAFYFGARFSFDKNERMRLFQMINDLPTIYEIVNAKQSKDQSANSHNGSRSKSSGVKGRQSESQTKPSKVPPPPPREENESGDDEEEEEDEEEQGEFCGVCGEKDGEEEFWIWCDTCEKWFHGKCVKMTPARAEHIKHYKCPTCSGTNKKHRA